MGPVYSCGTAPEWDRTSPSGHQNFVLNYRPRPLVCQAVGFFVWGGPQPSLSAEESYGTTQREILDRAHAQAYHNAITKSRFGGGQCRWLSRRRVGLCSPG